MVAALPAVLTNLLCQVPESLHALLRHLSGCQLAQGSQNILTTHVCLQEVVAAVEHVCSQC
jgi:hypothetical protein